MLALHASAFHFSFRFRFHRSPLPCHQSPRSSHAAVRFCCASASWPHRWVPPTITVGHSLAPAAVAQPAGAQTSFRARAATHHGDGSGSGSVACDADQSEAQEQSKSVASSSALWLQMVRFPFERKQPGRAPPPLSLRIQMMQLMMMTTTPAARVGRRSPSSPRSSIVLISTRTEEQLLRPIYGTPVLPTDHRTRLVAIRSL